jgi:hypothetical protein
MHLYTAPAFIRQHGVVIKIKDTILHYVYYKI